MPEKSHPLRLNTDDIKNLVEFFKILIEIEEKNRLSSTFDTENTRSVSES